MKKIVLLLTICCSVLTTGVMAQGNADITIHVDRLGPAIHPTQWGIFFEDINMAADGGLYAELVKNRSFEFNMPLMGWTEHKDGVADGTLLVLNRSAENRSNPRFIRVTHLTQGAYGISNEGFRGMGIRQGENYHFSVLACPHPGSTLVLRLELVDPNGKKIGGARLPLGSGHGSAPVASTGGGPVVPAGEGSASIPGWQKDTVSFTATATEPKAQLYIWFEGQGTTDLDMVSLFPQDTWKKRPGGLRADLVQLLADMKPGFIRFPGGCIVEGRELATRYQWKKTVGKVEDRQVIINRWNTEFAHRPTPDYYQSYGLGFFEYFQLAEDIGAEPLPILNCGMACQFNTAEVVPVGDLDPYIQDALDLIEFANGSADTKWGGLRAAMGHPAPFHLKMMGVGNEQWGPQYIERFTIFARAIKDRYPDIRLVNSVGPDPDGPLFNFLNDTLRKLHADILDEHYYRSPDWFLQHADRYDHYDRKGPKIFAGEYAAQSVATVSPNNKNDWRCALSEAAFMTGLERNADVVSMASYAPLFAHVDGWQWTPDLIWYDNLRSYGTPDYYVQKLFSTNKGSVVVPALRDGQPLTGQGGLYGSACIDNKTNELVLKLVNTYAGEQSPVIDIEGAKKLAAKATLSVLKGGQLDKVNSLDDPTAVSPAPGEGVVKDNKLSIKLAAYSFTVVRIKML
jgi:alpha-L-arabinofuranosidase